MDTILKVKRDFDEIKHADEDGAEFWYARELMLALGYERWESFHRVIKKAKIAMAKIYPQVEEHFREIAKKYTIAKGSHNQALSSMIEYRLSRYACYLIAQNGDPKKNEIADAQNYFTMQTRKQELETEKQRTIERILARRKLRETEKRFSSTLSSKGLTGRDIAEVRSAGDQSLFNMTTQEIKDRLGIKQGSLADHLPTITIKAKDLATEITTFNTKEKDLHGKITLKKEHRDNNFSVRKLLNEKGIYPERLAPEIDINKLEKRIPEQEISKIKTNEFIQSEELIVDIRGITDENELLRIKKVIDNNQGDSRLKIIYGSENNPRMMIRKIAVNRDLIKSFSRYLVFKIQ